MLGWVNLIFWSTHAIIYLRSLWASEVNHEVANHYFKISHVHDTGGRSQFVHASHVEPSMISDKLKLPLILMEIITFKILPIFVVIYIILRCVSTKELCSACPHIVTRYYICSVVNFWHYFALWMHYNHIFNHSWAFIVS
jgi:hypothetical protein